MEPFPSSTRACWRGPVLPLARPSAPVWRLGGSLEHPPSHCVLPSFLLANSGHPAARQLSAPPPLLLPSCWQPLLLITHKRSAASHFLHSGSEPSREPPACKCLCPNFGIVHQAGLHAVTAVFPFGFAVTQYLSTLHVCVYTYLHKFLNSVLPCNRPLDQSRKNGGREM